MVRSEDESIRPGEGESLAHVVRLLVELQQEILILKRRVTWLERERVEAFATMASPRFDDEELTG